MHPFPEGRLFKASIHHFLVIGEPHFGHFCSKQGTPVWCAATAPQLGQTQLPPGPKPNPPILPLPGIQITPF